MKIKGRLLASVFLLAFVVGAFTNLLLHQLAPTPSPHRQRQQARVAFVIDGDTIILDNGQHLRYLGIDAPEDTHYHDCFGRQATLANRRLVNHQLITFQLDKQKYDHYGRLLAYVWVGSTFVNSYLARQGLARLELIPPNLSYASELTQAAAEARKHHRGLWHYCPTNYRHYHLPLKGGLESQPKIETAH